MNIGIVIAVSEYGSLGNNLPGCKADGEAIAKILQTDSKFDDVLVITQQTNSGDVKSELIRFINSHKENEIEDVVFYFSGHGDFNSDEFYYLLSDYDRKRRKQTSLENTELDNLLKTLSPTNAIKIVDACHSGTPYIKDPDAFDSYLKGTQGEFKKCYFLFSSQADQYSYQDEHLSFFTKSIIESIRNHTSETVRYKDVIDYVSDSFSDSHNQTPFFIVQADFTEMFVTISETLKKSLSEMLGGFNEENELENKTESKSLLDLVKEDAKRFCTESEAISFLSEFLTTIKETPLSGNVVDLYDVQCDEVNEYSEIPSSSSIGKWLDSNEHSFFARHVIEEVRVKRKVLKNPEKRALANLSKFSLTSFAYNADEDYEYVISNEKRIKGFRSTVDLPVKLLRITIEPRYPNIDAASAYIVPIISKTEMRVFYSFNFFEQDGWNDKKIGETVKWLTALVGLKDKDAQKELSYTLMSKFSEYVYAAIAEKFDLIEQAGESREA